MGQKIEVDQSIKIEQTHADTRIGIVRGRQKLLVIIDAGLKRELLRLLRQRGVKDPHVRLFGIFLYLALSDSGILRPGDILVIDEEYPGQEGRLRDILASRLNIDRTLISFTRVGKRSEAHRVAYARRANRIIRYDMRDFRRILALL